MDNSINSSIGRDKNTLKNGNNPFYQEKESLTNQKSWDETSLASENPGMFIFAEKIENKQSLLNPGSSIQYDEKKEEKTYEFTPKTMFEYMMGIKSINMYNYAYNEKEVFISKPIIVDGNVMEIELETTENHPVFDNISGKANTRQTSIEYYISYKDNPNLEDWVPILAKSCEKVKGERLLLKNKEANLIFPANINTIKIYQNNILMDRNSYNIISNQKISLLNEDLSSIYTIDYTPDETLSSTHTIKLNDYKQYLTSKKEVFKGTAFNKTIELESYPFVDYERITSEEDYNPNTSEYKPISVRLINSSIINEAQEKLNVIEPFNKEDDKQSASTYNKTLYKDKSWSDLENYSIDTEKGLYNKFDYYQWKNKLVFTETFNAIQDADNLEYTHGLADIEVEYKYLFSQFRLKAILRRNTSEEVTVSPDLLNYKIKFKTMK